MSGVASSLRLPASSGPVGSPAHDAHGARGHEVRPDLGEADAVARPEPAVVADAGSRVVDQGAEHQSDVAPAARERPLVPGAPEDDAQRPRDHAEYLAARPE